MCNAAATAHKRLTGARRTIEHDDFDLVVEQQVECETLFFVRCFEAPHRREALQQMQLPGTHPRERRTSARAQHCERVLRKIARAGDAVDGDLVRVEQRVDNGDLGIEGDPAVRASECWCQVERVVLNGGQPNGCGRQSQRGVVGNDEHRPAVRRSHRETRARTHDLVVGGVNRKPCSRRSAVWMPFTCIRTVPPNGRSSGLRRSPPASSRNASIRRRTSRAAPPAGSRRFFSPSSSWTTVSGMTMSAPGNASKMPSGSDINADVSSTTILAMVMTSLVYQDALRRPAVQPFHRDLRDQPELRGEIG